MRSVVIAALAVCVASSPAGATEVRNGQRGIIARTEVDPVPQGRGAWNNALVGAGGVAAVVGVTLGFASLVVNDDTTPICFAVECTGGPRYRRLGGVPLLPVAASFVATSIPWVLTLVSGSKRRIPWLEFLIGTAVGLITLGTMLTLEGDPITCAGGDCVTLAGASGG